MIKGLIYISIGFLIGFGVFKAQKYINNKEKFDCNAFIDNEVDPVVDKARKIKKKIEKIVE